MRKQPGSPPAITRLEKSNIFTQVREYELITPLFGGGVAANETDPVTVVRGTEIRGHLRFWWRACRAGQFNGNVAAMKAAEDALWGAASLHETDAVPYNQTIQITVDIVNSGTSVAYTTAPSYAAFPLQSNPKTLQKGVSFNLAISYPVEQQEDIESALWAWETFGGIGARTRRGFGALHLLKIDYQPVTDIPYPNQIRAWITQKLEKYVKDGVAPKGLPHLSKNCQFWISTSAQNPIEAWRNLIQKLQNFRQDGRPGPSSWPEADAIRAIAGKQGTQSQGIQKFPRAAFGLPIIFHFKGNDPRDSTLQGEQKKFERLASPLILRPYLCRNNQAIGLALLLDGTHPIPKQFGQLYLTGFGQPRLVQETLTKGEAQHIPVLNGQPDVLQAFMNFLGGNTR